MAGNNRNAEKSGDTHRLLRVPSYYIFTGISYVVGKTTRQIRRALLTRPLALNRQGQRWAITWHLAWLRRPGPHYLTIDWITYDIYHAIQIRTRYDVYVNVYDGIETKTVVVSYFRTIYQQDDTGTWPQQPSTVQYTRKRTKAPTVNYYRVLLNIHLKHNNSSTRPAPSSPPSTTSNRRKGPAQSVIGWANPPITNKYESHLIIDHHVEPTASRRLPASPGSA